jgi:hypothetical protein
MVVQCNLHLCFCARSTDIYCGILFSIVRLKNHYGLCKMHLGHHGPFAVCQKVKNKDLAIQEVSLVL